MIAGAQTRVLVFILSLSLFNVAWAADHPRLYFSLSEVENLRQQAHSDKAIQFQRLQDWADRHLSEQPPAEIGLEERNQESCFSAITNFGLMYNLTDDKRYLDAGLRWLSALSATETGGPGEFIHGTFAAGLAHGYDLFYNSMEIEFREQLKQKLISVLEKTRQGAKDSWWAGIYTHHDFWMPVAFMGVAATVLLDEYENAADILQLAQSEIEQAMGLLGEEGYWPEGVADWVYAMAPAFMFFEALRRNGGKNFFDQPWMKNTAAARIQHWLPGDSYMYIGDSFPSGRYGVLGSVSAHLSMLLASRNHDQHAQWLAFREAHVDSTAPLIHSLENPYSYGTRAPVFDRERHGLAWQFLWLDPSVEPLPPDTLPRDKLFPNWDTAVFRAGWSDDSPVLAFCGGHLLGREGTRAWKDGMSALPGGLAHTHQNAGAVYLWADGRFPLRPPSFGGRDGRFHSTVMVNGHGQLFDPEYTGRVTAYESTSDWATATMDLTGAYPPDVQLGGFTRTIVYLKPRTLLLVDRLRGEGDNYLRRYEWLLHTDPDSARWTYHDDTIKALGISDGSPWLIGRVFPSYRYYFETQSLDRPDGTPLNRAMSVTIIGRMPSRIEIAAMLHAPAADEDIGWLHRTTCLRGSGSTTLVVPDGPYFVIGSGPKGKASRSVVFASADTVLVPAGLPEHGLVLAIGLEPETAFRLENSGSLSAGFSLVPERGGKLKSSPAGNLILREQAAH